MNDYTIIIADDHTLMRESLRSILNAAKGLRVIGEASDGLQLLTLLKKRSPHMVILDISMPGMRGTEVAREIRTLYPDVHVLMLSMHRSEEFLSMALAAGARGYLLKEDSSEELIHAVERIRNGENFLSKKMVSQFPSAIISICRGSYKNTVDPLSFRERQVLQMIAEGRADSEISQILYISLRTVHRHRANIRQKLNLKRTADLVRYAVSQGYATSH